MNKVALEIGSLVTRYSEEVVKSIEKRIDLTADEILDYIKKNAPKSSYGSKHLADSFIKTKIGDTTYISSQTKGRIVHLIELGFKHTSGKFVKGRPFLIPSYEIFTPKMLEDLKRIINNGT
jgi:hypothetical protein